MVVISHITLVLLGWLNGSTGLSLDPNFLLSGRDVSGRGVGIIGLSGDVPRVGGLVLVAGCRKVVVEGGGALTEVSFNYVDVAVESSGRAVGSAVLAVVGLVLNVDLCVGVTLIRLTVVVSLNVDLSVTGAAVAVLCVDVDFLLATAGTAVTVFLVNLDVLFKAALLTAVWSC